ncbi:helicase HerA domain-containing protein [Sphingomonas sp. HMP6]|uniref:helicase HerA domain-containing protein n=1 Tax=Sphingomonas sp. HMP6 TaxID=1517551 RepID=UPI001596E3A7|nr:DUF87 domain-containing protein [Sphingomonas sp. HMP6]
MTAIIGATDDGTPITIDMDEVVGSHIGIIANSGGGKSGLVRRLLEETHGKIQHIVLDIEDDFYTLRERFDYVIAGGDGADIPATMNNPEKLALDALTHKYSLIVQLNDLGEDAPEFVGRFLNAMISAPRDLWGPCLVVVDEAHHFAPSEGSTLGSKGVKALTGRGRKRGFTAVIASQRMTKVSADVRGDLLNWMLGRVGQTLDRNVIADQLGFTPAEGRLKLRMEKREFWGFGPAIAAEPVLFKVADVHTTMVKSGQAKLPTPPAPEALREILAAMAAAAVAPVPDQVADPGKAIALASGEAAELAILRARNDEWTIEQAVGQRQLEELTGQRDAFEQRALQAEDLLAEIVSASRLFEKAWRDAGEMWGYIDVHVHGAEVHLDANGWIKPGDLDAKTGCADDAAFSTTPVEVVRAAAERIAKQVAEPRKTVPATAARGGAPKAAIEMADLLDRVNPAKLTWPQVAQMTGRAATGGSFNTARKWLLASGRIVVDGEFIRSAQPDPIGMTRESALRLWKSVLTGVAPRMIAALEHSAQTVADLAAGLGAAPRGGSWNTGLAQLRRNGVAELIGDRWALCRPLPGEAP